MHMTKIALKNGGILEGVVIDPNVTLRGKEPFITLVDRAGHDIKLSDIESATCNDRTGTRPSKVWAYDPKANAWSLEKDETGGIQNANLGPFAFRKDAMVSCLACFTLIKSQEECEKHTKEKGHNRFGEDFYAVMEDVDELSGWLAFIRAAHDKK